MDCHQFEEFCEQHNAQFIEELLEEMTEAWLGGKDTDRVTIFEDFRHDAINYTITGVVTIGEESYGFIMDSGDRAGTVIRGWGKPEPYEPPKPTMYTLVPVDRNLEQTNPAMWKVYLEWQKQDWFKKLISDYMYDKHFAPGSKTESHYRGEAAKHGLMFQAIDND